MSTTEEIINVDQPTIVEIVLYRNNWKDNQLIHTIRRSANLFNVSRCKNSFYVEFEEFQNCLSEFDGDIKKFESITEDRLLSSLNSLYFLRNVFSVFNNLKFVKVRVSNERIYSRVVKESVSFSLKVIYSTIVLDKLLKNKEKKFLIDAFKELGFVEEDGMFKSTYTSIRFSELLDRLKGMYDLERQSEILEILFDMIDPKTEIDDPLILFIF